MSSYLCIEGIQECVTAGFVRKMIEVLQLGDIGNIEMHEYEDPNGIIFQYACVEIKQWSAANHAMKAYSCIQNHETFRIAHKHPDFTRNDEKYWNVSMGFAVEYSFEVPPAIEFNEV